MNRFIALVTGSFAAVLALITLLDQDLLLNFEITPGITALFYIGIFSGIFATAQSLVPEEHKNYDPVTLMEEIVDEIHYYPDEWVDNLHTLSVKIAFQQLFTLKLVSFFKEFMSLFGVVYLLWVEFPGRIEGILDFVDDVSVDIEGVGTVCSYAIFDFNKHGNPTVFLFSFFINGFFSMERRLEWMITLLARVGRWSSRLCISRCIILHGNQRVMKHHNT